MSSPHAEIAQIGEAPMKTLGEQGKNLRIQHTLPRAVPYRKEIGVVTLFWYIGGHLG